MNPVIEQSEVKEITIEQSEVKEITLTVGGFERTYRNEHGVAYEDGAGRTYKPTDNTSQAGQEARLTIEI